MRRVIASWSLWNIPLPAVIVILSVEACAVIAPVANLTGISIHSLIIAGFLISLTITYSLITCGWERVRRTFIQERQPRLTPNLLGSWCFAAAIALPIPLAAVVIGAAGIAEWPARKALAQPKLYRYVYSVASAVLAGTATHLCTFLPVSFPLSVLIAMPVYTGVNALLVALAIAMTRELAGLRRFLSFQTYCLEFITMAIAAAELALLHSPLPMMAWLSLPATIALQRHATKANIRAADDPHRRPMNEEAWLLVAREVIAACPVGAIMRVDTTDPAAVSYLARVQAGCDAIGMAGKSGLAVLLTECPDTNADALAVRLRAILHRQNIPAQVAVAAKPRDGQSLDDLLAVSEAELIARVAANRSARSERPEA